MGSSSGKSLIREKRIGRICAVMACVVTDILASYVVLIFANGLFGTIYPILNDHFKWFLEWTFTDKLVYSIATAAILVALIGFIDYKIYNILASKVIVRDKNYVLKLFSDRKYGSPALTRKMLARDICSKEKIPKQVQETISELVDKNIALIKKFFRKYNNKSVLSIDAKWGAGKTTSLLIAINEFTDKELSNRYIYESAFKYSGNINEFTNDLLNALDDTMLELGIKARDIIEPLICNLDSSPQKTLANFIRNYNRKMGVPSTELILNLNDCYEKSGKQNLIYIIVDDMDRLPGEDLINILSLLSILRKFNFVRIIVPADLEIVRKSLRKAGVVDAARFIEKYLPSKLSVKLHSGYNMAESVLLDKMFQAQSGWDQNKDGAYPALAAIFIGMLAKKLSDETIDYENIRYRWLDLRNPQRLPSSKEINEIVSQLLGAPEVMRSIINNYDNKYTWDTHYNNIRRFQDIIYAMKKRYGNNTPVRISEAFSNEEYMDIIDPWIFSFIERRWSIFGFTIRDAIDTLESVEYNKLPQNPAEQFVYIFNQLFPDNQLKIIK